MSRRVLIMGAAGRDFHNFNVAYRNSADHEVVAFTATQIPFLARRVYPPVLAGPVIRHRARAAGDGLPSRAASRAGADDQRR